MSLSPYLETGLAGGPAWQALADPRFALVAARASRLLGEGVSVALSGPGSPADLHPAEAGAMQGAVPDRLIEFAGGRRAAREALAALGLPGRAVPVGADRAPVWPQGILGSISHCRHQGAPLCIAAAVRAVESGGLGLDLELDQPLSEEIRAEVARETGDLRAAAAIFSAKESVFKALYPSVRRWFGFEAVTVRLSPGRFTARLNQPLGPYPAGLELRGGIWRGEGLILTTLRLPREKALNAR